MVPRDHHCRWDDKDAVEQFAHKSVGDFFRSETRFLKDIAGEIESVLDIGCAAGRFIELLAHYGIKPRFTGIDVSAASLRLARQAYPQALFIEADALECNLTKTYTLVNATGVCQHEPRFSALIPRMIDWSSRYVLFDVKFAALDEHLVDIERAYCGDVHRLYYILLSPTKFLGFLRRLPNLARISIYGYATPTNARTVVPQDIGTIVSAGVLLEKGGSVSPELSIELPEFLSALIARNS